MTLGIAKEQSAKGAALLEKASGQSSQYSSGHVKIEEEVRRLHFENKKLKSQFPQRSSCPRCGNVNCPQGKKCPANERKCGKCHKMNHFAKVPQIVGKSSFGQISSADDC